MCWCAAVLVCWCAGVLVCVCVDAWGAFSCDYTYLHSYSMYLYVRTYVGVYVLAQMLFVLDAWFFVLC